ncbi:H/ACA ribonucleoprotein complex subunit 2-like protein isoform X2 [Cherax quadricarinatus]|uniref:H/ACA ribonucleoprotein complex subunit 2-like protein isoform X2 n=1 Tax=Cherax quadricarinatus TaxID=27406 RepID=UPI002378FA38|nr:H/ACA ribonucleoprotein complex subunit 2-like protein isoform X2 [Cherax quadricarinatus]
MSQLYICTSCWCCSRCRSRCRRRSCRCLCCSFSLASTHKTYLEASVKGVQKWLRKGMKGIVVFAGNVSPIEVMCHLPALCEDNQVPYIYTPSREDLGAAMGVTRGVLCVFVREHEDYKELYNKALDDIKKVPKMY